MKMNLKWRNRFSGEEGYVGKVSRKDGCFYATFDAKNAKTYISQSGVAKDLEFLASIGENTNNEFFTVEV